MIEWGLQQALSCVTETELANDQFDDQIRTLRGAAHVITCNMVLGVAVVADIDDVAAWLGATPGQSAGVTGSRVQRNQIREGKGLHVVYTAIFDMAKNHIEVLNC